MGLWWGYFVNQKQSHSRSSKKGNESNCGAQLTSTNPPYRPEAITCQNAIPDKSTPAVFVPPELVLFEDG
eukprot:gene6871-9525_t